MSEEWSEHQIGDFCDVSAGGTPDTSVKEYWEHGTIPWMSSGEVHKQRIRETESFITPLGLQNSSAKFFPKDSVLVALAGQGKTRGKVAISKIELTTNQSIAAIIAKQEICDPEFLYHNLSSRYEELRSLSGGSGRAGLNLSILSGIEISLPPLPEQKKIAEILSGIDKSIYSLKWQRNKHLLTYQDLLDDHFRRSLEISSIPLGKTLSRSIEYGANASASPLESSGLRFLRITDIKEDGTLSEAGAVGVSLTKDERNKYQVSKGDVLLARTGNTVGKSYLYKESDGKLAFAGYLLRITPDKDICLPEYFFLYTQSSIYKKWVSDTCRTGAQPNINAKEYGAMPVPSEPINDQQFFIEVAMAFRDSISAIDQKIKKQSHLKQALANGLLSGRKRVSV